MDKITREQIARIFIEEALVPVEVHLLFVPEEHHTTLYRNIRRIHEPHTRLYFPHGMTPPVEEDGEYYATFCIPIILDQLEDHSEEELLQHLRYWVTRMQVRLIKEMTLLEASEEDDVDEIFLEELVEAEMEALGLPRPDIPALRI